MSQARAHFALLGNISPGPTLQWMNVRETSFETNVFTSKNGDVVHFGSTSCRILEVRCTFLIDLIVPHRSSSFLSTWVVVVVGFWL
jgi:hypothetical protein